MYLSIGDHVKAEIFHFEKEVIFFEIKEISKVYGYSTDDDGKRKYNTPIVSGTPLDQQSAYCSCGKYIGRPVEGCAFCNGTGVQKVVMCNSSWVTEILKKGKSVKGKINNVYKNELSYFSDMNSTLSLTKSTLSANSFACLLTYVLKHANINVVREINSDFAYYLYMKNPIGLINIKLSNNKNDKDVFVVNKKRFKKWVIRNLSKLYVKVKELHEAIERFDREMENEAYGDYGLNGF